MKQPPHGSALEFVETVLAFQPRLRFRLTSAEMQQLARRADQRPEKPAAPEGT